MHFDVSTEEKERGSDLMPSQYAEHKVSRWRIWTIVKSQGDRSRISGSVPVGGADDREKLDPRDNRDERDRNPIC
jgi:hypothetical protein